MKRLLVLGIITLAIFVFSRSLSSKVRPVQGEHDQSVFVKNFSIPGYSPVARQALIQGEVSAIVHISPDGSVGSVSDIEGPPLLADEVRKSLKSWTFGFLGNAVRERTITFRFRLEGENDQMTKRYRISGTFPDLIEIVTNPPQTVWPNTQSAPQN